MTDTFTLYKLMILYMLRQVDFPLTTAQLSGFILDRGYTDYFKLQEALSNLIETELIEKETTHSRTLYRPTKEGIHTINLFREKIPQVFRKDMDDYLGKNQFELRDESSVKADFYETKNGEYVTRCQIMENGASVFDLSITIPTRQEAVTIAEKWTAGAQDIYSLLMTKFLS